MLHHKGKRFSLRWLQSLVGLLNFGSFMKQAFTVSRRSYDGANFGLKRHNYRVWWQGKGGMVLEQLLPRMTFLLQIETAPDILAIHCRRNNIGKSKLHTHRKDIKEAILTIQEMLLFTNIVKSQILPQSEWRYSRNCKAMIHAAMGSIILPQVCVFG